MYQWRRNPSRFCHQLLARGKLEKYATRDFIATPGQDSVRLFLKNVIHDVDKFACKLLWPANRYMHSKSTSCRQISEGRFCPKRRGRWVLDSEVGDSPWSGQWPEEKTRTRDRSLTFAKSNVAYMTPESSARAIRVIRPPQTHPCS